jgi:hypothetical protein
LTLGPDPRAPHPNQVLPITADPNSLLDCSELLEAFKTLRAQSHSKTQGTIPFDAFPENVQDKLKELDLSGDGKIDAKEIIAGMQALQREKQKTRQLLLLVTVLGILMCLLLGAICGMLFAVIDMTKESRIGSSGVMLVKGTSDPVRVASTDFTVINGVLSTRGSQSNQTCGGGVCPSDPIQVSEVLPTIHRNNDRIAFRPSISPIMRAGLPPNEILVGNRRRNAVRAEEPASRARAILRALPSPRRGPLRRCGIRIHVLGRPRRSAAWQKGRAEGKCTLSVELPG